MLPAAQLLRRIAIANISRAATKKSRDAELRDR
jgi:hypothetical protein